MTKIKLGNFCMFTFTTPAAKGQNNAKVIKTAMIKFSEQVEHNRLEIIGKL